jgi:hypothetical protein
MKTLKAKRTDAGGFTIVELMVAVLMLGVVILGIGMVLADSQRGWNDMYDRVYSDVVTGGHVARRTFDSTVRQAGKDYVTLASDGSWVQVRYYQSAASTDFDRYARFYVDAGELKLERGTLDPVATLSINTICPNVSSCVFSRIGKSVQMVLELSDGTEQLTVVTSAVAHN